MLNSLPKISVITLCLLFPSRGVFFDKLFSLLVSTWAKQHKWMSCLAEATSSVGNSCSNAFSIDSSPAQQICWFFCKKPVIFIFFCCICCLSNYGARVGYRIISDKFHCRGHTKQITCRSHLLPKLPLDFLQDNRCGQTEKNCRHLWQRVSFKFSITCYNSKTNEIDVNRTRLSEQFFKNLIKRTKHICIVCISHVAISYNRSFDVIQNFL